ncbi:WD40-repeat-containing domain protein [Aspergillus tetrazonus]
MASVHPRLLQPHLSVYLGAFFHPSTNSSFCSTVVPVAQRFQARVSFRLFHSLFVSYRPRLLPSCLVELRFPQPSSRLVRFPADFVKNPRTSSRSHPVHPLFPPPEGRSRAERADWNIVDLADAAPFHSPSSAAPDLPNASNPSDPILSRPNAGSPVDSIPPSPQRDTLSSDRRSGLAAPSPASTRRRRLSPSDTLDSYTYGTGGRAGGHTAASEISSQDQPTQFGPSVEGHPPFSKRRRLANMRPDGISSTNNFSQLSKGGAASPAQKAALSRALNGQASYSGSNGEMKVDGFQKPSKTSSYFNHDREEVTRILIQSLYELGYSNSAALLSKESGYQLESPAVAIFRNAVLEGRWAEAERILVQSFQEQGQEETASKEKLALVENAEKSEMLFYLRQQKFLELLDARDLGAALMVLRHELTPLNYDVGRLHALSSTPVYLCVLRNIFMTKLAGTAPSASRGKDCYLSCQSPSLYSDHMCDRDDFPLGTKLELNKHTDEVWHCQFSHDGTKLVTAGRDSNVIIYDTSTFSVLYILGEHKNGVAHAVWSPDDTKLITCSRDSTARVWSTETGRCLLTINKHQEPVTAAVWAPDGESFVTASLDVNSQLCHWNMRGESLYMWHGGFRVYDCAITPDGRRLIAVDVERKIRVYNFHTHEEEYILPLKSKATSVVVSRDSRHMLVNLTECQIQLIDIETSEVIRRFQGQKQSTFIIRSTFGGAAENFVVSGSEENGTLVETLEGHLEGCVNAISWNPADPGMFASAGDDCLVKIWTRERDAHPNSVPGKRRAVSGNGYARTSALRSTSGF